MEKAVSGCRHAPEFLPVSANPFYCIPTGNQSPYGDLMMTMLESLVECKGESAKVRAVTLRFCDMWRDETAIALFCESFPITSMHVGTTASWECRQQ